MKQEFEGDNLDLRYLPWELDCILKRYTSEDRRTVDEKCEEFKREINSYIKGIEEAIKIAADAVGTAFEEDPSRFVRANEAESFEEYIEICRG